MEKAAIITTTLSTAADAKGVALKVLEKRLAACVQISAQMHSLYRWKGGIEQSDEYRLTIKTREGLCADLEKFLKSIHPYETPEIFWKITDNVETDYLQWLIRETAIVE